MSFKTVLTALGLPYPDNNIDVYANSLTNELYACSKECGSNERVVQTYISQERSKRLLSDQGDSRIWHAIDWCGEFNEKPKSLNSPSYDVSKEHFGEPLNPDDIHELNPRAPHNDYHSCT